MTVMFDERKNVKNMIAEGGEGRIYKTPRGTIVKIFKKTAIRKEKETKVKVLLSRHLPPTVVAPVGIVTTPSGTFSGYEMPMVHGDEIRSLSSVKFVRSNAITKLDIITMLVQIKDTLKTIHAQGMFIGDLNDSNILFDDTCGVHFIDVDSWSIPPYNCNVIMDAFKDPLLSGSNFNEKTDAYAFAILAYKALTRIHPFGGTLPGSADMDIVERMKSRISVFSPGVIRPIIVDTDSFMPGKLRDSFKRAFEQDDRSLIDAELDEFKGKMVSCDVHHDYYYGGYMSCPVCVAGSAEMAVQVVMPTIGGIQARILFQPDGVIMDDRCYVEGRIVKFRNSSFTFPQERGVTYHVTDRGDVAFRVLKDKILATTINGITAEIPTRYKSPSTTIGDSIYFISPGLFLTRVRSLKGGFSEEPIEQVAFTAHFTVIDPKTYFIINVYDDTMIASMSGYHVPMTNLGRIENVSMHHDGEKKQWLLVVDDGTKAMTTILDERHGITWQSGGIHYPCQPSKCDFNNGFIYIPSDGKITRVDPVHGTTREFDIPCITTGTAIKKIGPKFTATDATSIIEVG